MAKAVQKTALPTRKLSVGATLAPLFALYTEPVVSEIWPQVMPAIMSGPQATAMAGALSGSVLAMLIAYWVPDAPNIPVS